MRNKLAWLTGTTLAGAVIMTAPSARAQVVDGLYIGAGAGVNILQTERITGATPLSGFSAVGRPKISVDIGVTGLASVGYGFGNGLRAELEGGFRDNAITSIARVNVQRGESQKYSAMVNVLYDFDLSGDYYQISAFTPYIGAGAGYAYESLDALSILTSAGRVHGQGFTNEFAVQGIAGVAFPLTELVPGLSLTAEYRFFATPDVAKYDTHLVSAPGIGRIKVANDFNHSVMVGVRYAFDTSTPLPPVTPAPVAAPTPAPTRTYLVFFDWDRADLTARAKQIIADAASNAGRVSTTRIEVNGHADRSGTPQYNQGLSMRRAQAVSAELQHDGVRANMIDIHAYGDTRPLVPTAAGVREPQNRRVEIIIK